MPLYEYKCRKCGHAFEHLARSISEPAPKCPRCGAPQPQKQLSAFVAAAGGAGGSSSCSRCACPTGTCPLG